MAPLGYRDARDVAADAAPNCAVAYNFCEHPERDSKTINTITMPANHRSAFARFVIPEYTSMRIFRFFTFPPPWSA